MDEAKRRRLEARGWKMGTVAEFLGLTPVESNYIEIKVALTNAIRFFREKQDVTQNQLAKSIKSSQSRVAKMEAGDPSVSLDLLFKAILALGVSAEELLKHLLNEINPYPAQTTLPVEDLGIETGRFYLGFKPSSANGTLVNTFTQGMGEKNISQIEPYKFYSA